MIQLLMFDAKGETFRDEMFGQYKSHFPPPDERQKLHSGCCRTGIYNMEQIKEVPRCNNFLSLESKIGSVFIRFHIVPYVTRKIVYK